MRLRSAPSIEQRGEFAAAIELRRRFPGITDNAQARECARTIAGWKPLPLPPVKRMPKAAAVAACVTANWRPRRGDYVKLHSSDARAVASFTCLPSADLGRINARLDETEPQGSFAAECADQVATPGC